LKVNTTISSRMRPVKEERRRSRRVVLEGANPTSATHPYISRISVREQHQVLDP
jgi:hypothetical protein